MANPSPTEAEDNTGTPNSSVDLGVVAREMVKLFKSQFGRGPTVARAYWAGPDTLICILEDTLTPAERKLVDLGQHQAVRDIRTALEHATVPEFCAPIEELTGRKVRAFTSSLDTVADGLALEMWVLHPHGYEGIGRVERGYQIGEVGSIGRRTRTNVGDSFGPIQPS